MIHLFFGTMCKGKAHGDFERRTIPVDSKRFNFTMAISSFFGIKATGFYNNRGVAHHVNVVLHWKGVGNTSPVRRMEGYF
jgi:hypothetical protein